MTTDEDVIVVEAEPKGELAEVGVAAEVGEGGPEGEGVDGIDTAVDEEDA